MGYPSRRERNLRGSALYFFLFACYGSVMPFLPLIWRSKGISEHDIGILGAIRPLASFFVAPVACAFADRNNLQHQILLAALVAYPLCLSFVLLAPTFLGVLAVQIAASLSICPINSLIDSLVIRSSGTDGYNSQRRWGAVGFGIATLFGGYVSDSSDGKFWGIILLFLILGATTFALSTTLTFGELEEAKAIVSSDDHGLSLGDSTSGSATTSVSDSLVATDFDDDKTLALDGYGTQQPEQGEDGEAQKDEGEGVFRALRIILSSSESATFFAGVALSGMGMGVIDTFLFIWVMDLGGNHFQCGLARTIMCMAEVPFFTAAGLLVKHVGVRGMVSMTQAGYLTRFIYYSVLRDPWWVLPAEVLHGLTFATMWTASTTYANEIAPENLHSTFQGLVTGVHMGLGYGLGAVMGGIIYATFGARRCFGLGTTLPSLSLTLLSLPTVRRWCSRYAARNQELGKSTIDTKAEYELVDEEEAGQERDSDVGDGGDVAEEGR